MKNQNTKKRSLIKAILWETIAVIAAIIFFWIWFGSFVMSLYANLVFYIIKSVGLYFYERGWTKIEWGIK